MYDRPPLGAGHPLLHPSALHHLRPPAGSPPDLPSHHGSTNPILSKPRIWSLADLASKESKDDRHENSGGPHTGLYPAHQHNSPGKIISPLVARIPNYPYVRPDIYRGFYGSPMGGPSVEFLDHQRQFGALAAHNGLAGAMNPLLWKAAVSGGPPFAPLSLTTNHNNIAPQSGASPSASSSSSSSVGGDHSIQVAAPRTTPTSSHHHHHHHQGPISGNSTTSSSSSSSGKLSPAISVTSTPTKP